MIPIVTSLFCFVHLFVFFKGYMSQVLGESHIIILKWIEFSSKSIWRTIFPTYYDVHVHIALECHVQSRILFQVPVQLSVSKIETAFACLFQSIKPTKKVMLIFQ